MNSAAADCGAVDLIFRRTNFPPVDLSAGEMETIYGGTCGLACQYAIDQ